MNKGDNKIEDRWTQGYACAVVCLIKLVGEADVTTKEVFAAGIGNRSLNTLEKIGVDEYDLITLKKYWKDLH